MIELQVNKDKILSTENLVRVGDLLYFEGPYLTLYADIINQRLYLFDWVDNDETSNRWLIYQISPDSLLQYINQEISQLELFNSDAEKDVYFIDISSQSSTYIYSDAYLITEFSDEYLPSRDKYFNPDESRGLTRIRNLSETLLSRKKTINSYLVSSNINRAIVRARTRKITRKEINDLSDNISSLNRVDSRSPNTIVHGMQSRPLKNRLTKTAKERTHAR